MNKLKSLIEQRNDKVAEMQGVVEAVKAEERAMNTEEMDKFNGLEKEIKDIDATIKAEERARGLEIMNEEKKEEKRTQEEIEVRSFENYIKSQCGVFVAPELRSGEQNFTMGNNGAVIPTSIANRVISTVKEMCPIFEKAHIFNVKGTLKIPVYGLANTTHDIAVGYQAEFTDITADAGQFTSVDLGGFLAGALSLIGKSVINNGEMDVTGEIIKQMATKIALFLEKELLNGTTSYATGALATTNTMMAGSTSAISADNLIDLQAKVKQIYQADACWTMAPDTFKVIKKLKDGNGQYLIQSDFSQAFPFTLLGKPVNLSENMPAIGSAAKAVLYGDYSGLAVNMREDVSIQILLEKYATMHAVGIVSWFEFDSEVEDHQKLATLVMSVS